MHVKCMGEGIGGDARFGVGEYNNMGAGCGPVNYPRLSDTVIDRRRSPGTSVWGPGDVWYSSIIRNKGLS